MDSILSNNIYSDTSDIIIAGSVQQKQEDVPDTDLENYYTKEQTDSKFQLKGDYAYKSEIPTKIGQLENDKNFISEETDPTVPAWAKELNKPTYNANEVGAIAKGSLATINGKNLEAGGNIEITGGGSSITVDSELSDISENPVQNKVINTALKSKLEDKDIQAWTKTPNKPKYTAEEVNAVEKGSLGTINGQSLEDGNNVNIVVDSSLNGESLNAVQNKIVTEALNNKQPLLVDRVNIKTINGDSILGEGNLEITGGGTQGGIPDVTEPNKVFVRQQGTWIEGVKKEHNHLKKDITDFPTEVSSFHNDAKYLVAKDIEGKLDTSIYDKDKINYALKTEVPKNLSELTDDTTHRVVTDVEKNTWNKKQDAGDYVTTKVLDGKGYLTSIPEASKEVLGGVKVGAGLSITKGVLSATGGGTADSVEWTNIQNKPTNLADWNAIEGETAIANKPIIPSKLQDLTDSTEYRTVSDTEKQTWNAKSDFDGDYDKLSNLPTIPSKTSELNNNSNFVSDAAYVHTDNNYSSADKQKVNSLETTYVKLEEGKGLSTNDFTTPLKTRLENLTSVYKYKGSKPTYNDLPKVDNAVGDVWNIVRNDVNYAWTGVDWDPLGGTSEKASSSLDGLMSKDDYTKLNGIEAGAQKNAVTSVAGRTGTVTLTKSDITDFPSSLPASDVSDWAKQPNKPSYTAEDVGLGNVDNTSDADKPISNATQTVLDNKAAKKHTHTYSDLNNVMYTGGLINNDNGKFNSQYMLPTSFMTGFMNTDPSQGAVDPGGISGDFCLFNFPTFGRNRDKYWFQSQLLFRNRSYDIKFRHLFDRGEGVDKSEFISLITSDNINTYIPSSLPASDVPDWAKQPNKPSYTAEDVGALPDTTEIPTYTKATTEADGLMSKEDKKRLDELNIGNAVTSVAGKTGAVTLEKKDVGLDKVDNTSDANKPISTATQTALDNKAEKVLQEVVLDYLPVIELEPNKLIKLSKPLVTSHISLKAATDDSIVNEYMLDFFTDATPSIVFQIPGLKWLGGTVPEFKAKKHYQLSIVNNLAVLGEF